MSTIKKCFVPKCKNNSVNAAHKLFLTVPQNWGRRAKWFEAVGLSGGTFRSHNLYCCEDHFDIKKDSENWRFYETLGKRLILKPHVVPRKTEEGADLNVQSQFTSSGKKRKLENLAILNRESVKNLRDPPNENPQLGSGPEETSPTDFILVILKEVNDSEEVVVELNPLNSNESSVGTSIKEELVERDPLEFCENPFETHIKKEVVDQDPLEISEIFVDTGIKQELIEIKEENLQWE